MLAAVVAAAACAKIDSPTGPTGAIREASLGRDPTSCLKAAPRPSRPVELTALPLSPLPLSTVGVTQVNVLFTNATCQTLAMYWVRPNGEQVLYAVLQPGDTNGQDTYVGHVWLFKNDDTPYAVFRIEDYPSGDQEVFLGCTKGKDAFCN